MSLAAFYGGFYPAAISVLKAPQQHAHITPTGAGDRSGKSWDNAATLADINAMIVLARSLGGDVLLRADQGDYFRNGNLPITQGGTADRRVVIRGVDGGGNPTLAVIGGSRANPWIKGAANGAEVFRVRAGADYLGFAFLRFENQGYGCIRSNQPHTDLTIEDCEFANCQAFYENGSSGKGVDATVSGLTIRRCSGYGFSKHFARLRYSTHKVLIEDCYGDAQEQDKDNFCNGIVGDGSEPQVGTIAPDGQENGVHDVVIRRCQMGNCRDTLNSYQNGDGFGNEGQDYNWHFEDTVSFSNSDGGYDCKSRNTTFLRCGARDCKRGWRIWGDAVCIDCWVENPRKRGGTGAAACISTFHKGFLRWYGGRFTQVTATNSMLVAEDGGFTAYTPRTVIQKPASAALMRVEANSIVTTIDEADTVGPVLIKSTYRFRNLGGDTYVDIQPGETITLNENKTLTATISTDKPAATRVPQFADYKRYTYEGQNWTKLREDFEAPIDVNSDNVYEARLRLYNANGYWAEYPLAVQIANVDDNPISAAELKATGVTNGAWWQINDLSTLYVDRAGTIPVAAYADDGDPIVRRVVDKLGFGNHLIAPSDDAGFYLRNLEDVYWLEPQTDASRFEIGGNGSFRFPIVTSCLGIYREPGETGTGVLLSVPRSATIPTSSNSVWCQLVQGGQSYGIRSPASGNQATTSGNFAIVGYVLVLTMQTEIGLARSNAVDALAFTANPSMEYPFATAGLKAKLLSDGNGAQLFNGRFYGGVVTNRTESDLIRFRIERQIGQWAGVDL